MIPSARLSRPRDPSTVLARGAAVLNKDLTSWAIFAAGAAYCLVTIMGGSMVDGHFYWVAEPYTTVDDRYGPPFYFVTAPLQALSWEAFQVVWTALHLLAVAWLAPWTIVLAYEDVIRGNTTVFLAVALVLGVTGKPWAWPAILLTKVTPGVGLLYHVGRREWRALAIAVGVTLAIMAVGMLVHPHLWMDWFGTLLVSDDTYQQGTIWGPRWVRVGIGAGLCLLAARWVWLLPIGMILAMPGLWPYNFALLAAIPRLLPVVRRPGVAVDKTAEIDPVDAAVLRPPRR